MLVSHAGLHFMLPSYFIHPEPSDEAFLSSTMPSLRWCQKYRVGALDKAAWLWLSGVGCFAEGTMRTERINHTLVCVPNIFRPEESGALQLCDV
jgi:hypothetical protein